jgi:hypothetical protein
MRGLVPALDYAHTNISILMRGLVPALDYAHTNISILMRGLAGTERSLAFASCNS